MKTVHDLVVEAKKTVREISIDQALKVIQTCDVLIDVRENDEYLVGHLPDAIGMSRGMLPAKMMNIWRATCRMPLVCRAACWSS